VDADGVIQVAAVSLNVARNFGCFSASYCPSATGGVPPVTAPPGILSAL
jgi:hypothetical protein